MGKISFCYPAVLDRPQPTAIGTRAAAALGAVAASHLCRCLIALLPSLMLHAVRTGV